MEKLKKSSRIWLCVGLVLCLIGSVFASLIQSNFGHVKVEEVRWITTNGYEMTGTMFIPEGVSAEKPAPAIVVSHGMYNNREMQDLNFVELSRRGFVVLSMDMLSHGDSANVPDGMTVMTGMYQAVKMLASIDYVDAEKIGVTGHSLGGMSSNMTVALDNLTDKHLVSAVLLNSADATYTGEDGKFTDVYGSRDVGVIAGQYDEWFFRDTDADGNPTVPRDYIKNKNAQSFLNYGSDKGEVREAYTVYHKDIDGKDAMRVIYTPSIIHPWSHFSQRSTVATIDFFTEALGAPNPIDSSNQIWQWKAVFNLVGLIGFALFMVNFAIALLFTPFFESLRAKEPALPLEMGDGKSKAWFFGSLALGFVVGTATYLPILRFVKGDGFARDMFAQSSPWGVGCWAAVCGLVSIITMVLSYKLNGKKKGFDLRARGVTMSLKNFGKTILLALIAVTVSYGLVFVSEYAFGVDYRIWVIALRTFTIDKLPLILFPTLPLLGIFYIANSVAMNSFNYNTLGKKSWVNTLILAVVNGLPAFVLLLVQYIAFRINGELFFPDNMYIVWLFPVAVYLPLTVVLTRRIYKASYNPYIGGIMNAIVIAIISCANTLTWA